MPGFGALEALDCPHCKGKGCMFVTRRVPDPEQRAYERQTFQCAACNKTLERTVDKDGIPPAAVA
jgi:uncharacterized protein YbaR (Trm112 family)